LVFGVNKIVLLSAEVRNLAWDDNGRELSPLDVQSAIIDMIVDVATAYSHPNGSASPTNHRRLALGLFSHERLELVYLHRSAQFSVSSDLSL
jgi:hypothetical protein